MRYSKLLITLLASVALTGCGASERLANIGKAPDMTKIVNPVTQKDYQPVSLPMPAPEQVVKQKNSLWASNRQTFFKDQRATNVGDIITVNIKIDDEAKINNKTERTRESSETAEMPKLLGGETKLGQVFSEAIDPTSLIDLSGDSGHKGEGKVDRKEQIEVKLAALVTQILPNGNMVIHGRQEVLVNYEKRILAVDGVIRPQDIAVDNSVPYEQIAEARITYGGEGQLTDVQQPRYGQQLYDVIFPF
ncbi:MAG: flagellar basal body L-ring protein FlgH [Alphaproteobacteria bacterium]|nr:flagellar basal body L-ring protein FlgH [Alphaproteobacteria bacterium]